MAISEPHIWVLAKQFKSNKDAVTIHGFTDDEKHATSWYNSAQENCTFQVDTTDGAQFDPIAPDSE